MIPSAFYKVISTRITTMRLLLLCLIVTYRAVNSASFVTTIDEVEARTNLDFFANTSDDVESDMEAMLWEMWPTSE